MYFNIILPSNLGVPRNVCLLLTKYFQFYLKFETFSIDIRTPVIQAVIMANTTTKIFRNVMPC